MSLKEYLNAATTIAEVVTFCAKWNAPIESNPQYTHLRVIQGYEVLPSNPETRYNVCRFPNNGSPELLGCAYGNLLINLHDGKFTVSGKQRFAPHENAVVFHADVIDAHAFDSLMSALSIWNPR